MNPLDFAEQGKGARYSRPFDRTFRENILVNKKPTASNESVAGSDPQPRVPAVFHRANKNSWQRRRREMSLNSITSNDQFKLWHRFFPAFSDCRAHVHHRVVAYFAVCGSVSPNHILSHSRATKFNLQPPTAHSETLHQCSLSKVRHGRDVKCGRTS